MLRTRYCIANWKMNFNSADVKSFLENWNNKKMNNKKVKAIFCPSFTELNLGVELLEYSDSQIGAQNVSHKEVGSYTGEISCDMIKNVGCELDVLILLLLLLLLLSGLFTLLLLTTEWVLRRRLGMM